jgi:hypothetical protein
MMPIELFIFVVNVLTVSRVISEECEK